jgi:hypothetical protein
LEKEKEDYKNQHESEIEKIKNQKNIAEEEKNKLIQKLQAEIAEQKKQKDDTKQLILKYRERKQKVLNSDETKKKVIEQENEINTQKAELEKKRKDEEKLLYELEQQKKKNMKLQKEYESTQANIDDLDEKINYLRQNIEKIKAENKEYQDHYEMNIANLQEHLKSIQIENIKRDFIITNFVNQQERERLEKCMEYNEKDGSYTVNKIAAIKNN